MFASQARKQVNGISNAVAQKLMNYSWPGNVRELRNVIERAVALTRYEQLAVDDLPEKDRDYRSSQVLIGGTDPSELVPLEEVERQYILHVLKTLGDNKTLAARVLGLDRKTLYKPEIRPPSLPWIDPMKEINAYAIAVEKGFRARQQVIRDLGGDPRQVDALLASDPLDVRPPVSDSAENVIGPRQPNDDDEDQEEAA